MTNELKIFYENIDASFFRYAHISGAIELYMHILENTTLQKAFSRIITGNEIEWKEIHRFMIHNGQKITWYPEIKVQNLIDQKANLLGYIYGMTQSAFIGDFDYYLFSILKNKYDEDNFGGNSWNLFFKTTNIDARSIKNYEFIYNLIQERHKIEHNKAIIDRKYIERMASKNIRHIYQVGDSIQKSHIDILETNNILRDYAKNIDDML